MSKIKEFWLDPNKDYTRNELRDMFSTIGASTSFIVHYKGRKYIVHEGNCNVEDFICKLIPDEYERFTQISSSFIIPKLRNDSDDSTRLKYGSEFKGKFKYKGDFDEFLNTNLNTFHFNNLLPKSLSQKYMHNSFFSWDLSFLCDDEYAQKKLNDAYNEHQRQFKREIINEYKIALESYEAEEEMKRKSSALLYDHNFNPRINFMISLLVHAVGIIIFARNLQESTKHFWAFIIAEAMLFIITAIMLPDCYYDDDESRIDTHYARIYEIFTDVSVIITMIMIFINFPQLINIGGKFIMSLFK